jgi:hypothetical protein
MMAGTYILFMLFYLYAAVGNSWSLVVNALFDSRILGVLWISVSSAFSQYAGQTTCQSLC